MSHKAQMDFVQSVKNRFPQSFKDSKVLEVGSYDVNGTVRIFFENCEYLGIDVAPGKGVDLVCQGQDFKSEVKFDTVITCEMFEHNPEWVATWLNILELCKVGGLVVMTCASTGRGEHGTRRTMPDCSLGSDVFGDYYANLTEADFRRISDIDSNFSTYFFMENTGDKDLYFFGIKK